MPQENQRLETRHVGASKWAFRARHPPILTLCSLRIDVFLRVLLRTSNFATSKWMFRATLPSIFSASHKMQRLPRNLHLVATWRSPANAIRKTRQHHTSKVLRLPRKMTTSKVLRLPRKLQHIMKTSQKYCACNTKRLSTHYKTRLNVTKCHACPAKRSNEKFETSKTDRL